MAEYLSEEEQLAQLKSWWQRYGWWLVAGVVLGLGGYFVLQYLEGKRAATNAAASEVFERYQEAPSDEQVAKPLLARLDGEFAGTAYHVLSLMTRAQLATEAGDVEAAIGFYRQATDGEEVEHFSDVARLRLARALQQQDRGDDALKTLGLVSGEGYRSLVAELKGDILHAKGDKSGARDAYSAAIDAQGDNPRTLLSMKLKNLSAPEGTVADADADSDSNSDTEVAAGTETEVVNEAPMLESESIVEATVESPDSTDTTDTTEVLDTVAAEADTLLEDTADAEVLDTIVSDIQSQAESETLSTAEPQ